MPQLFTPINSYEVLKTKTLTILFKMCEGTNNYQENFAYANLILDNLDFNQEDATYSKLFKDFPVIGFNALIGTFTCVLTFKVVGVDYQHIQTVPTEPATENKINQEPEIQSPSFDISLKSQQSFTEQELTSPVYKQEIEETKEYFSEQPARYFSEQPTYESETVQH